MFLDTIKSNCQSLKDKVFYICNGQKLTFGNLWRKSYNLACYLKSNGETPVIVYGHKSPFMLISFLACLISGRAYVPCDISLPKSRLTYIIEKTNSTLFLSTEEIYIDDIVIINENEMEDICFQANNHSFEYDENKIAYIIFTSGSTGVPKGVPISHKNLDNFINWVTTMPTITNIRESIVLNQASYCFDLSVADIYISLIQGNTLYAITREDQSSYSKLFYRLKESNCELMVCTPTFMKMCLCDGSFNRKLLHKLNTVFFCGEILTSKVAMKLMNRFPNITLINAYGPTEATCAVSAVEITKQMLDEKELPIGEFENTAVHISIVDSHKKELPSGEYGEILLCGQSVSNGYLGNTTTVHFESHNNCYLTGDIGKFENGYLYYHGRKDDQIKFKAYRIELSEIEIAINDLSMVNNAVVLPIYDKDHKVSRIAAFIERNDQSLSEDDIIKHLSLQLPNYMIPQMINFLDVIPVNENGKSDRKTLRELLHNGKHN